MDYALPHIVKLPRLTPRPVPVARSAVESERTLSELDMAHLANTEDNYDLFVEDFEDIDFEYDLISELSPQVADLNISSTQDTLTQDSVETMPDVTSQDDLRRQQPVLVTRPARIKNKAGVQEKKVVNDPSNLMLTKNGAATFRSSKDARVDFFFEVLQGTDATVTTSLVKSAWKVNSLDTLRLIFNLRSIRDGKGERDAFYTCLDFLRREHPKTLLYNLRFIPDHGYWKDLLTWLVFECRQDADRTTLDQGKSKSKDKTIAMNPLEYKATTALKMNKSKSRRKVRGSHRRLSPHWSKLAINSPSHQLHVAHDKLNRQISEKALLDSATAKELARLKRERADDHQQRFEKHQRAISKEARKQRWQKSRERLDRACAKFEQDVFYRTLHIEVARLFARALKRDRARMIAGKPLSLVGKWCPSLNQFHDKHTLISTTIAQILFPDWLPGEVESAYIHRVRQALRTEYYVPLRKAIPVLEPLMTSYRWDEIDYSRVPAVAMKNNKKLFEAHDKERFEWFLDTVDQGEDTIASASLMPHQLVHEVLVRKHDHTISDTAMETTELQWRAYVERLKKRIGGSTFKSCMAMCDTSDSMQGQPMEAAIGLSLLLAELTEPPFNSHVMSFAESPGLHKLDPAASFASKVASVKNMSAGLNTDLFKAFELLLNKAIKDKLPPDQMIKTLFIFSDMEFDQAVVGGAKKNKSVAGRQKKAAFTSYHTINVLYRRKGYELPRIVFWNLSPSTENGNKPVLAAMGDTALISGFSGMMMKTFLKGGEDLLEDMDPIRIMEASINGPQFSKLKVLD